MSEQLRLQEGMYIITRDDMRLWKVIERNDHTQQSVGVNPEKEDERRLIKHGQVNCIEVNDIGEFFNG